MRARWTLFCAVRVMHARHIVCFLALAALGVVSTSPATATPIHDLRVVGSTTIINGATFTTDNTQPLGTGHNQFLGIQGPTSRPQNEGYNTDPNSNMEFDTQPGTNTDPLALASLTAVNGNYQFLLDIDQTGVNSFLSLDRLEIYLGNSPTLTNFQSGGPTTNTALPGSQTTGFGANSVLVYNMDASPHGSATVLLDFDNDLKGPGGSGIGDMLLLVPTSFFAPYSATYPWIYLYSRFGDTSDCLPLVEDGTCVNNGGPERWHAFSGASVASPPPIPTPEPASLFLLGTGLTFVVRQAHRRAR